MKTLLIPLSCSGLLAGGLLASDGATHSHQDGFEVTSTPVAGKVHVLNGRGGNIGASIGDDGVLLIDDQFVQSEPHIRAAIEALGKTEVTFLVNTHWHGDHTGSNAGFGEEATIIAHENVRRRLAGDPSIEGRKNENSAPPAALPVVTHEDGLSLYFNGERVRLLTFGHGHTDGDTVVWFTGSNVVHMGDLYFDVGYPFVDLSSGGGVQGLIRSLKAVLETVPADVKVISGHGRVTDTAELKEYLAMIETVTERVREAQALGETPEQMVANGITADLDERWGGFDFVTPIRFVTAVHESLSQDR